MRYLAISLETGRRKRRYTAFAIKPYSFDQGGDVMGLLLAIVIIGVPTAVAIADMMRESKTKASGS